MNEKRLCSPVSCELSVAVHVDRRHHHGFAQLPDVEVVDGLHPGDTLDLLAEVRHADAGGRGLQQQQPVPAHLERAAGLRSCRDQSSGSVLLFRSA